MTMQNDPNLEDGEGVPLNARKAPLPLQEFSPKPPKAGCHTSVSDLPLRGGVARALAYKTAALHFDAQVATCKRSIQQHLKTTYVHMYRYEYIHM